ncbi:hypothetical protein Tco_0194635 [Tanacetum coccineum]
MGSSRIPYEFRKLQGNILAMREISNDSELSVPAGSIHERNWLPKRMEPADLQNVVEAFEDMVQHKPHLILEIIDNCFVLDDGNNVLKGGIVVVEEVVKWNGDGRSLGIDQVLASLDLYLRMVFIEEVFRRDLKSDLEKVMVVVDCSFLVEDHPKRSSKGAVKVES